MSKKIHLIYTIAYLLLVILGVWIFKTWLAVIGVGFSIIIPVTYIITTLGYTMYHLYKAMVKDNGRLC